MNQKICYIWPELYNSFIMGTLNCLIIDDEKHCRDSLSQIIAENFSDINLLEICTNPKDGITAISKHDPDLVFLDVEMPGMTGFELLQQLPEVNFEVIFTTAYDKYAVRAIKASALDFLLKPVGKDELSEALVKVRMKLKKTKPLKQLEVLFENIKQVSDPLKKIVVPTLQGFNFIYVQDIIRLEGESNYTTFYFKGGQKLMVSKTLKEFEDMLLDHHFFRVHQSHLINLRFLKNYIKGEGGIAVMEDGSEIDVSRRRKEEFVLALKKIG